MDRDGVNEILGLLNESPTWNNEEIPVTNGMVHILIGTAGTGKTTYATNFDALEYDHAGSIGDLAVHLVAYLLNNQTNHEENQQHAVSMHYEDDAAVTLVRSLAEHFERPVRVVWIEEYGDRR